MKGMTNKMDEQERITPTDFTPITEEVKQTGVRINPLKIIVGLALFISLIILWFLLSAKSVVVTIKPNSAQVNIDGGITFELADHYLIRPGEYSVTALTEGYIDLQHSFVVGEDDHQLLALQMVKKPGHLEITTNPPNAEVLVDGELIDNMLIGDKPADGTSPKTISPLLPGQHQLEIKAPRYFSQTTTVEIEGLDNTQNLQVDLKPAWGFGQINTSPAGADVLIGETLLGKTPITIEILSEGEEISIRLPGYKSWSKKLTVNTGETVEIPEIVLEPADGIIELSSRPSGATVTVDGNYRGTTPITLDVSAHEQHEISLFLNGHITRKKTVSLTPGETEALDVSLAANKGDLQVVASPTGASVWIDGTLMGNLGKGSLSSTKGKTFSLPSRPHSIEIKKPGYATQTRIVTPQPKLNQVVRFKLLTEQQARWASTPKQITTVDSQTLKLFKPKGTFTMGASRRESGRRANEVLRQVQLTRPFYLATKEITNSQFKQFQRRHSSRHVNGNTLDRPSQPVVNISWSQAALYCNWLSKKENLKPVYTEKQDKVSGTDINANGYRLPTEAEWAWAARATARGEKKYGWGSGFPPRNKNGNFADVSAAKVVGRVIVSYNDGHIVSAPVGSFPPNEKGLYDLAGNVAEWVNDYYGIEFSLGTKADKNPTGPTKGEFRMIRGASWRHANITELRLSFRDYSKDPRDDIGFRIARYVN